MGSVVRFTDGKYECLALVTAGQLQSAWAGSNEKGFCIMNSVSPDFRRGIFRQHQRRTCRWSYADYIR